MVNSGCEITTDFFPFWIFQSFYSDHILITIASYLKERKKPILPTSGVSFPRDLISRLKSYLLHRSVAMRPADSANKRLSLNWMALDTPCPASQGSLHAPAHMWMPPATPARALRGNGLPCGVLTLSSFFSPSPLLSSSFKASPTSWWVNKVGALGSRCCSCLNCLPSCLWLVAESPHHPRQAVCCLSLLPGARLGAGPPCGGVGWGAPFPSHRGSPCPPIIPLASPFHSPICHPGRWPCWAASQREAWNKPWRCR